MIKNGCSGCKLVSGLSSSGKNKNIHSLRCQSYAIQRILGSGEFVDGKFSKQNAKEETIKVRRCSTSKTKFTFGIMAFNKMRAPRRQKQLILGEVKAPHYHPYPANLF